MHLLYCILYFYTSCLADYATIIIDTHRVSVRLHAAVYGEYLPIVVNDNYTHYKVYWKSLRLEMVLLLLLSDVIGDQDCLL